MGGGKPGSTQGHSIMFEPLEIAIIALITLLLFGANKVPEVARATGQTAGEFKRGQQKLEEEIN